MTDDLFSAGTVVSRAGTGNETESTRKTEFRPELPAKGLGNHRLYNIREVTESLKFSYGEEIYVMKCGKLQAMVMMKEGKPIKITLEEVRYVPGFHAKLFSIPCAMKRGARTMMTIENGPVKLEFGSRRKEANDFVLGLELKPIQYYGG